MSSDQVLAEIAVSMPGREARMRRGVRIPDRSGITDATPLSLDVAARIAFPDGSMSRLSLRNAATRGDLGHARIGGRVYTTLAEIERMVAARWVEAEPRQTTHRRTSAENAEFKEEAGAATARALQIAENLRQTLTRKMPKCRSLRPAPADIRRAVLPAEIAP
ncbi:hypothetical protein [Methylorubrum sp. GM97]|uniref:hypothetical protein n=1 Tax=Methylorubrum sp. GM97 TaxID=2938232 RepID=UPI0021C2914D|nr:hypothetical protein [Methylorubrum sp. GM97]